MGDTEQLARDIIREAEDAVKGLKNPITPKGAMRAAEAAFRQAVIAEKLWEFADTPETRHAVKTTLDIANSAMEAARRSIEDE